MKTYDDVKNKAKCPYCKSTYIHVAWRSPRRWAGRCFECGRFVTDALALYERATLQAQHKFKAI